MIDHNILSQQIKKTTMSNIIDKQIKMSCIILNRTHFME